MASFPSSVLFCCDHNAVRSPMAEIMMKAWYPNRCYVQSAGVYHDQEVDGFAIFVCREIGLELALHQSRSFDEMEAGGYALGQFDLIIALSPASQRRALELTRLSHLDVVYWPVLNPVGLSEDRDDNIALYRQTRDQIRAHLILRFGVPVTMQDL